LYSLQHSRNEIDSLPSHTGFRFAWFLWGGVPVVRLSTIQRIGTMPYDIVGKNNLGHSQLFFYGDVMFVKQTISSWQQTRSNSRKTLLRG